MRGGMSMSAIERLVEAVGYPERVPAGAARFAMLVDGGEIVVEENAGRVRLVCKLTDSTRDTTRDATSASLPRLVACAAGRMLREEAALACDDAGAFLWQDADANADAHTLRRLFETFADSCDWWRERVSPQGAFGDMNVAAPQYEMRILP